MRNDPKDLEPWTPNHFLKDPSSPNQNITVATEKDINGCMKRKGMRAITHVLEEVDKEYILTLTKRRKWTYHQNNLM